MSLPTSLDQICKQLLQQCEQRDLETDENFIVFFIHLLARDARLGLNERQLSVFKIQRFLDNAMQLYSNATDPTMCNIRMIYLFKHCKALQFDDMKKMYENEFQEKTHKLIHGILQYPETSTDHQLDEILFKMQIFIIVTYNIGDPTNHVLLEETRQSIKSVLSRADLKIFIKKKHYHRLEYLQRLTATVCGILIYNNCNPDADKENMRDVIADINMAKQNTKESLDAALNDIKEYIKLGIEAIDNIIELNAKERKVICKWPIEKVREINKYVVLFKTYEHLLKKILRSFEHTEYLLIVEEKKRDCILEKLRGILLYRTAIESQLVFPHFKYLAEIWTMLQLYLSHLAELSKLKDALDNFVSEELKNKFRLTITDIEKNRKVIKEPTESAFAELQKRTNKVKRSAKSIQKVKKHLKDYCALTLAVTNGLLMPAKLQKKICEDLQLYFGFTNIESAKYAEQHFEEFITTLKNAIYTSVDLILLFDLGDEILQDDFDEAAKQCEAIKHVETQTEMVVENDLSNATWNAWDFHRETIHRTNLMRKQTTSQQTKLSFGTKNQLIQKYNRKENDD